VGGVWIHFNFSQKGAEPRDVSKGTGWENSWTSCAAPLLDYVTVESLLSITSTSPSMERE